MKLLFAFLLIVGVSLAQTMPAPAPAPAPVPAPLHSVTLTWLPGTGNPTTVMTNIYRLDGPCPTIMPLNLTAFVKLNSTPIVGFSYQDITVVPLRLYCYTATGVAPVDGATDGAMVESEGSSPVPAIVPPSPPRITVTITQ